MSWMLSFLSILLQIKAKMRSKSSNFHAEETIVALCLLILYLSNVSDGGNSYSSSGKRSAVSEFRSYEVAIPRIFNRNRTLNVTAIEGVRLPGIIFVEFSAFLKFFSIQLVRNNFFISDNYTEKVVKSNGEIYRDPQNDLGCYYTGHLVGQPAFKAAFSACSGLRGYVRTDTDDFHLEPWDWSPSGRHYVFRESDYTGLNLSCGHKGRNLNGRIKRSFDQIIEQRQNSGSWKHQNKTRIVELYLAADYAELSLFRGNATNVFRRMKEIVNIISSFYLPMNIFVILVGAEVWEQDRMDVVVSVDKTLSNFLEYRRFKISPKHSNDNAQLITGRAFSERVTGKAPIMTMCTLQYSGAVMTDYAFVVGPVASTLAHQLGHSLGLLHDAERCDCPDDRCIMSAFSGGRNIATKWSECSQLQFSDSFHQGMDYCLFDKALVASGSAICGNGVTEDGEDCDCGLPEDCSNRCCNATSCTIMANATCAAGGCCDLLTCQLRPVTTECRIAIGGCDLGEYCDGVSPNCPSDVFSADGRQCSVSEVKSYCYQGKCNTHDNQCRFLWGSTGQTSHNLCFEQYNVLGNVSGHCGVDWLNGKPSFRKCEPQDAICGMLHCHHLNEKLMFWKENLAYSLPEASVVVGGARQECKGAILDVGFDMPDPGMVPNGAACGKGKACFSQRCLDVQTAFPNLCPDCHGNGVCNSVRQCHCDIGYAPPFCDKPGNGGSSHGGPIRIHSGVSVSEHNVLLIVGLCVFFFLFLLLLLLIAFCIFRHRQRMKYCWIRRNPEKYSSVENVNICASDSYETAVPEAQNNQSNLLSKAEEVNAHPDVQVSLLKTDPVALPIRRPLLPSRPLSVVLRPNPPPKTSQAKRASSITSHDISSPKFLSSTNINLDSTLPLSKIRRGEFHGLRETADDSEQSPGDGTDEFHSRTLPNRSSKPRSVSSNSRDASVRISCVDTLPSEPRFSPGPVTDTSIKLRPQQSLPEDSRVDENVYEEINLRPACPKIPPPNPPNSQRKVAAAHDLPKPRSQIGNSSGRGGVSSAKTTDVGRTDAAQKLKAKPGGKSGEKEPREQKSKAGTKDSDSKNRVARKPRPQSSRSPSVRSSAANNNTSGNNDSLNSDSKRPKMPTERNQR